MYKQLVVPNINITYRGGWCQEANEKTVGQIGIYGSAYKAWLANVQHTEIPPTGIYAPIYLNMPNGPKDKDGTQQDDVALICPDGSVRAAALSGTHSPLFKYASLDAYVKDYARNNGGATYRGYGEYIGTVKVIEGETVSKTDLNLERILAYFIAGRNGYDGTKNALLGESDDDLKKNHVGTETNASIWTWYGSAESKKWVEVRLPEMAKSDPSEYSKILSAGADLYIKEKK